MTHDNGAYVNRAALAEAINAMRRPVELGRWEDNTRRLDYAAQLRNEALDEVLALIGEVDIPRTEVTEP